VPKNILLNLVYLHKGVGGVWVYVSNYLKQLHELFKDDTRIEFYYLINEESRELVPNCVSEEDIQSILSAGQARNMVYRLWGEHIVTRKWAKKWEIDDIHWFGNHAGLFSNTEVTNIITVHDLLPFESKNLSAQRMFHAILYNHDARRANNVFVPISQFTAGRLKERFNPLHVHDEPITNCVASTRQYGKAELTDFRKSYNLENDYMLYVAHFYEHKNHKKLLDAFESYRDQGGTLELVLRGDAIYQKCHKNFMEKLERSPAQKHVTVLPRLETAEMELLYQASTGTIFPSGHEGGGIPVMESYVYDKPVACSRLPVFEEYYGALPHYFDPQNISDIIESMHWLEQKDADKLDKESLKEIRQKFSPQTMQNKIHRLYEQWLF